jgi:hypothetical protein
MAWRTSLSVHIAAVVSVMVALLLGLVTLVIGLRLSSSVADLVKNENMQISNARSDELGQLLDKLHSQLNLVAAAPQILAGDRKIVMAALKDYVKLTSAEGRELIFAYLDGSFFTTGEGRGDISDRGYFSDIRRRGARQRVSRRRRHPALPCRPRSRIRAGR